EQEERPNKAPMRKTADAVHMVWVQDTGWSPQTSAQRQRVRICQAEWSHAAGPLRAKRSLGNVNRRLAKHKLLERGNRDCPRRIRWHRPESEQCDNRINRQDGATIRLVKSHRYQ